MRSMAVARAETAWDAVLEEGREEQLVSTSREAARPGVPVPVPPDLHPRLAESLGRVGIEALWSHQADALESVRRGTLMVTTGTAN